MKPMKISGKKLVEYYYQKDAFFGKENGEACQWVGYLAQKMGLEGKPVDFEQVANLAAGYDKDGENKLVGKEDHSKNAATDLPITLSKSISVAGLCFGDEKLLNELKQTFKNTAEFSERFIEGRETIDGVTRRVEGDMLGLLSIHSVSRATKGSESEKVTAIDPHLHGHLCAINTVQKADGTFSTLENKAIFTNQKLIQQFENNEAAMVLVNNDYGIKLKANEVGMIHAEVRGIPEELNFLFSSSHNAIKNAKDLRVDISNRLPNLNPKQVDNLVQLQIKSAKNTDITQAELEANWQKAAGVLGIDFKQLQENSRGNVIEHEKMTAAEHVTVAITDINKNESKFTTAEVLYNAMKQSVGQCSGKEILTAVQV